MIEKKPFRLYNEDQTDKPDIFSIRLNNEEREILEEIKEVLDVDSDSKALKFCLSISRNVIFSIFGEKILSYLFKEERIRYTGNRRKG